MLLFNLVSGVMFYIFIGFTVAMLGYRYRGWKATFDEEMLVAIAFMVWPFMLCFWVLAFFFKYVLAFGRAASVAADEAAKAHRKEKKSCQSCGD